MTDILDFQAAHDKRHGPDPEHVWRDPMGVQWFRYMVDFEDGDKKFGFEIWATSDEDAERRVGLIRQTAKLEGKLYSTTPA